MATSQIFRSILVPGLKPDVTTMDEGVKNWRMMDLACRA
jgi:hypothetical protein